MKNQKNFIKFDYFGFYNFICAISSPVINEKFIITADKLQIFLITLYYFFIFSTPSNYAE